MHSVLPAVECELDGHAVQDWSPEPSLYVFSGQATDAVLVVVSPIKVSSVLELVLVVMAVVTLSVCSGDVTISVCTSRLVLSNLRKTLL